MSNAPAGRQKCFTSSGGGSAFCGYLYKNTGSTIADGEYDEDVVFGSDLSFDIVGALAVLVDDENENIDLLRAGASVDEDDDDVVSREN